MHETFPIIAGLAIALVVQRMVALRFRIIALVVYSALFGAIATFISGEMFVSWAFLPIDVALVLLTAAPTMILIGSRQRWLTRRE